MSLINSGDNPETKTGATITRKPLFLFRKNGGEGEIRTLGTLGLRGGQGKINNCWRARFCLVSRIYPSIPWKH
jgi:hypothetical protein